MLEVFIDSLLDSLKVLAFVFAFHFVLSFFEGKVARFLESRHKAAPAIGAAFGLIPECGTSVVASDLYLAGHLSLGTLVAVFLSCSDEALPILFSDFSGKWYMGLVMVGAKFLIGTLVGLLVDLLMHKSLTKVEEHLETCEKENDSHLGCCRHEIEGQEGEGFLKAHLLHPVIHSLKIFAYVFVITFLFGIMVYYVGEDNISSFVSSNYYLTPLLSTAVGLIPNCASSVLLSTLYISGSLPFGALLSGLLINAGLGMMMLFRGKGKLKMAFLALAICLVAAIAFGYAFLFIPLP